MQQHSWIEEAKFCFKFVDFVLKNGAIKGPNSPFHLYETHGLSLRYDKLWFTGDFRLEKHRVAGKDWEMIVAVNTGDATTSKIDTRPKVKFLGSTVSFVGVEYGNRQAMERDLTLLRMFGIEDLFQGR